MKKIIPFVVCIGILPVFLISCNEDDATPVVVNESCFPEALEDGLIAAYSFAGGSLEDHVGISNLTAVNAAPAADRGGNPNCAFGFQGDEDSYLITQDTQFLNALDEMTVSLWYLPQGQQVDYELLIGRGDGFHCPDTNGEWSLGLYDVRKAVFGHGDSVWEQVNPQGDPVWKFVTATVNKSDNTISIYINGVLEESSTGFVDCGGGQTVTVEDLGNLLIGKKFNGTIDDILIYSRILTQAEITQLYELVPCCE